ncbi:hypothetical protein Tco_0943832 [Tanacetum coccineum]
MGRDTIQLEDAVSTISQEYLLEFSSEYYIPENLHPELPGPGDHIVDFPEGKNNRFFWVDEKVFPTVVAWRTAATKDDKPKANTYSVVDVATLDTHRTPIQKQPEELLCLVGLSRNFFLRDDEYPIFLNDNDQEMDLFNLIKAPNPTKVKTGTRQRTTHEVPLLTATANRVIQMVDATELSTSLGIPSTVERSPLDFSNEDAPPPVTQGAEARVHGPIAVEQEIPVTDDAEATEAAVEPDLEKEVISMGPTIKKRHRQRDASEGGSNAPNKVLRKDHDAARVEHNARGGKSLANMSVDTKPAIHGQETQEPPVATQSVSDPDPLSYAKPQPNPKQDVIQHPRGLPGCDGSHSATGVARRDQRIATREKHIKDLEAQLEAEINMKKVTKVKNSEVTKELKDLRMCFSGLEVGNDQLSQQVSMLQARVIGEERIMADFEVFKKHEDERVNARCVEMDAWLDALSIDFDEELYPHMLTAIAGRRWVIGHGLRLAVMKCAESTKLRQAFANVVSAGIAKGMSEGLKYGVEHGKAGLELTTVEAYDPKVDSKYVATFHDLKDLNYPLIDQLEQLKDAPLDVIMASLYLDSDTSEDAPQFIRDLRPSSSQIKIPMYPEVHDPRNPWACKEEILLEDAIAANKSRAEKKKKSRVLCRTHRVGSAHHARSDGIPVSVPTVAP